MKNSQFDASIIVGLIALMITIAALGGYIANIVKLTGLSFATFTPELVMRVVGIVLAPLGVIMGYL